MPLKSYLVAGALTMAVLTWSATAVCAQEKKSTKSEKKESVSADTTVRIDCPKIEMIGKIIDDAISIGAPVYNSGYHLYCYRVYEWAGYKILYEFAGSCPEAAAIIKTAIDKSHGDYSETEKAWIMRAAFDKIMGVPTQFSEPKKTDKERTIQG
jgi:hypothetical protein